MMQGMDEMPMSGAMMWGMGAFHLIALVALILVSAAAIKYLRS